MRLRSYSSFTRNGSALRSSCFVSVRHSHKFTAQQLLNYAKRKALEPTVLQHDPHKTRQLKEYNTKLNTMLQRSDYGNMEKVFQEMITIDIQPDLFTCALMCKSYSTQGKANEMEAFMEEMRRVNLKPDLNQYTTLMDVFAKQGNIEKMKYYYDVLKAEKYTPSVITYNTLMNGYGSKGDLSNMMTVYENMRKEGAAPSRSTLNILLNWLGKHGEFNAMFSVFRSLSNYGIEPNTMAYNILIDTLGRKGKLTQLNQVLEQLKQSKEPWDAVTYHSLIVAYGCCGHTDKMLEVLEQMKRNKFTPMEQTYRAVLYGIARNATPEQLFQYYNDYLRQGHVQPSEKLYVSLMNAKWVTHDATTMIEIFDTGVKAGVQPTVKMYVYLACAYAKKGDAKMMNDCLLQMKRLGVHRPLGYIINYGVPKNVDILDIVETNVHFQSEPKPHPHPQHNNKFVSDSAVKKIEELLSFP